MNIWMTIFGMAVVTYAVRAAALLLLRAELPQWVNRWLGYVPVAVFTALILPPLVLNDDGATPVLALGPALPAGLVGALVAWRTSNVVLTIGAGLVTFWVLRFVM